MEPDWKDCGWKHTRAPSVRLLWKEEATGAILDFLEDMRMGCRVSSGVDEDRGEAEVPEPEGEEGGLGSL